MLSWKLFLACKIQSKDRNVEILNVKNFMDNDSRNGSGKNLSDIKNVIEIRDLGEDVFDFQSRDQTWYETEPILMSICQMLQIGGKYHHENSKNRDVECIITFTIWIIEVTVFFQNYWSEEAMLERIKAKHTACFLYETLHWLVDIEMF